MVAHQTFCKHCRDGNFVPNATKFGDIHCYKTEKINIEHEKLWKPFTIFLTKFSAQCTYNGDALYVWLRSKNFFQPTCTT